MIKFKTLSIQNFLSYGATPTVINLDPGGTTLIVGEDLDNTASGTGANGVGKTVWLNGLVFGLYGKPVSNISLDNLVNNINQKHLEVIIEFQKDDLLYTIKRVRKEKGLGNYAKVYRRPVGIELDMSVNSEQDVTPDSVSNINAYIETALGIPHELFVRIVAFSATHTPFLDLPVRHASQANQSAIMEELFRLNRLSEKAGLLKEDMKNTKQSLEIKKTHNEQLEKEHARHNDLLVGAEERVSGWDVDNKEDIKDVDSELVEYIDFDVVEQQALFDNIGDETNNLTYFIDNRALIEAKITKLNSDQKSVEKEIELLSTQLAAVQGKAEKWTEDHNTKITDYESIIAGLVEMDILDEQTKLHISLEALHDEVVELKHGIRDSKKVVDGTINDIDKVEEELAHLEDAKCPFCLQQFEDADKKIKEYRDSLKEKQQILSDAEAEFETVTKNLDKVIEDIDVLEKETTHWPREIEKINRTREDTVAKLEDLRNEVNPYSEDKGEVTETESIIKELTEGVVIIAEDIETESKALSEIVESVTTSQGILDGYTTKLQVPTLNEFFEIKNKIEHLSTKLRELKSAKNPHMESYDDLKAVKLEAIDMDSVNDLDKLLTHQNYMLKLLTKKDSFIRKNLLNKNLVFLNQRLRTYLIGLGLPHKVEFTQEMTAHISQFGRQLDFGNLSSGQKARVNLALSFSFRDVLEHSLDSVNVCMLDEVLDVGLDSVGVQNAAKMLKHKSREDELSLFIISHRDEVSGIFDKVLTVQMEKGFSHVKTES